MEEDKNIQISRQEAAVILESLRFGIKMSEVEAVRKLLPAYESLEAKLNK